MMKYKFYSPTGHLAPVAAVIDYTGNARLEYAAYFDYDPAEICDEDGEENFDYLSSGDLPQFARNINAAIRRDWKEMKLEKRGFMETFLWGSRQAQASVYEKVKSAAVLPGKEILQRFNFIQCQLGCAAAFRHCVCFIIHYFNLRHGGWGEGFEQHAIPTKWGALYVCFWPDDFMIETEEEFHACMSLEQTNLHELGSGIKMEA